MPDPSLIATVSAYGQNYDTWQSIVVERSYPDVVAHARFTVAELSDAPGASGINAIRLKPFDPVTVTLAGRQVMSGLVTVRQAAADAKQHGVEIVVTSQVQKVVVSTVDGNPGQYINATLQQIASACFGAVGINFSIAGSPVGADKPFDRVSEHIGETRFEHIERLCRMRNLHMLDDGTGSGIVAVRAPTGTVSAGLVEGQNILKARMVWRIDDSAAYLKVVGQRPLTDQNWTEGASSSASTATPGGQPLPVTVCAETTADDTDCGLRVNHERDLMMFSELDLVVTVPGWLLDDGSLWYEHYGQLVKVNSPMLFGGLSPPALWIKGVSHKQSNDDGTTTDIMLTNYPGGNGLPTSGGPLPPPINIG